jgi:hypothetical protein
MDLIDKQWTNIRDRFYTIKPFRKSLYVDQYEIEKQTGIPVSLHLMFSDDKIKEEYLYSLDDPVKSLLNGISNPYIIGVCKNNNDSFYLIVHNMPKHPGWHNGSFITTYYNLLYCYHELHFMKGSEILNSISDDVDIKTDIYKRLELMGDSNSIISKYNIYEYFYKYDDILIDIVLILKKLNPTTDKPLKSFISSIKKYLKTYKDFQFEKILQKIFIYFYENNKYIASYIAKNLSKELKNINKDGHSNQESIR